MTARGNEPVSVEPEVLELYKLAVEMADRVSARRATANTFFFTVQAGLAVSVGAFAVDSARSEEPETLPLLLAAIAGVVIAASWWLLLRSYRDLNTAKFEVITRIEHDHLPIHLFTEEWAFLREDPVKNWRQRYAELGQVESVVPLVFVALYVVLSVYIVAV